MAVTSRELHSNAYARRQIMRPLPVGRVYGPINRLPYLMTLALCALALLVVGNAALQWGQVRLDDLRYGRPRTTHLEGWVGHNEGGGNQTQFVAMNLNRQVIVFEIPGGDVSQTRTLKGPYLFGANEDLTPVHLKLAYVNDDKDIDLVISVKNEQIIYINDKGTFRLITAQERADYERNHH
ncbi:MAG: hypothetical protein NVS4B8_09940 [Herpetosiphon sp.]